jgi:S-DNA-T family DNA segregation ATPase FtsK/SpoIIIE
VAIIQGRNAVGIELPNPKRDTVYLSALLNSGPFRKSGTGLPLALGETIEGEPYCADLTKMPHLLIAGTTGSGKSVGINAMILSLLYRHTPDECRFIMIDPKMLELSVYEGIPHLLSPVVTEPKKAVVALKWVVREMEERYRKMSKLGVKNIGSFNDRVREALENGENLERVVHAGFDRDTGEPIHETRSLPLQKMPFIVVVIDEMADLMLVAGKEIETAVQRLAAMARAAGIHLIMATQRPSVDVITGTIKANFPTRISYKVTSKIDSRTILDQHGSEQLVGFGDLLMMEGGNLRRLHGPFVSEADVDRVVEMLKAQGAPSYRADVTEDADDAEAEDAPDLFEAPASSGDALYDQAVEVVMRDKKVSTSYLQRRLQVGYNRAASLVERLEKDGVISSPNHQGKREVLLTASE